MHTSICCFLFINVAHSAEVSQNLELCEFQSLSRYFHQQPIFTNNTGQSIISLHVTGGVKWKISHLKGNGSGM